MPDSVGASRASQAPAGDDPEWIISGEGREASRKGGEHGKVIVCSARAPYNARTAGTTSSLQVPHGQPTVSAALRRPPGPRLERHRLEPRPGTARRADPPPREGPAAANQGPR